MNKKITLKLLTILLFFILCFSNIFADNVPNLNCKSAIIVDNDSGKLLFGVNENEKIYPASTTKVLTAILALENLDINSSTVVSQKAIDIPYDSSNAALRQGEVMTIKDLLYALMLKSGNDSANALAEAVSGDIDKFVVLMNQKAKDLGCTNTNFTNTHGYHDDNHYTTPSDMMKILSYAIENETFVNIFSTKEYVIEPTNKTSSKRTYDNTNRLILTKEDSYLSRFYEYCIGGKTGYTEEAGRTLVAYGKKDDKDLIIGVFNASASGREDVRYTDAINLFEYGFNNFSKYKILDKKDYSFSYVNYDNDIIYNYSLSEDIYTLVNDTDADELVTINYDVKLDYDKLNKYDINTSDYENQVVGKIKIDFRQNLSTYDKEYDLVLTGMEKIPFLSRKSTQKLLINIIYIIISIFVVILILKILIKMGRKKKKSKIPTNYEKGNVKYKSRRKRKV